MERVDGESGLVRQSNWENITYIDIFSRICSGILYPYTLSGISSNAIVHTSLDPVSLPGYLSRRSDGTNAASDKAYR